MKTKKLLLALPMVAVLASCSGKIEVYRDIFKDARNFTDDQRQEILDDLAATQDGNGLKQYKYEGTRSIVTYMDNEEIGRKESNVLVTFSNDDEYHQFGCYYGLDGEAKYQAYYDSEEQRWEGETPAGVSLENLYEKFKNNVYSWNGHVLVGNYDVAPYEYNTKLLNCVSAKFSKQQLKNVKTGNFTLSLNTPAGYSDGEIRHQVNRFNVTYANHRVTNYLCDYRIVIEDAGIIVNILLIGTFDYTYMH